MLEKNKKSLPTKVTMRAEQLASLDLLIARKKNNEVGTAFVETVAPATVTDATVGPDVQVVAVPEVIAVADEGGGKPRVDKDVTTEHFEHSRKLPLKALIELRNSAISLK